MRILVSCIPYDAGKSGISVYIREVVGQLRRQGHELTLLVEPGAAVFFPGEQVMEAPKWSRSPVASMCYHLFVLPFQIPGGTFDFLLISAANRRTLAWYPLPAVAVVHDLSWYHIKAKYDIFRTLYLTRILPFFVRRAPAVVAISRSTASDLERYWNVSADRISVVYNGLTVPEHQRSGWLTRQKLTPGKYLLYISRLEVPGKNHLNLIKAFELLPESITREYFLVLAGADWFGAAEVHAYAENSPLRDRILFSGFLPSEDLAEAYANAACYVFPSLFEGFGLSLIEAMYYGTPCCCSETSSLGEIGREAALLFDPERPDSIAAAIRRVLTMPELAAKLRAAGKIRAAEFDWGRHAAELVAAAQRLAGIKVTD